ncbi:restriction endonuclease [Streptomyces sp. ISL-1]|uniref:restriction endonuclease n=1 Tax=Streptomyces sp. ISL-1 TaxID=2817657 RepID=UPI001BE53D69|nr:restriction endonuclease [Streptomyces sp. ISL-1]MBT2390741.1 restriction endonuclease [Streptomyces sp. ISL-1]
MTEFEEFSTCWPDDQLKAKGLVADIRKVVNVKDSFTRLQQEQEAERRKRQTAQREKEAAAVERRRRYQTLQGELSALFQMSNPQQRGIALEALLNKIFAVDGLSIREAFVLRREDGQAAEQIDGAVELDGSQYAVEVKWWSEPLGRPVVSEHLVRIFNRAEVRGLMISASGFTQPAIDECRTSLTHRVMVLGEVHELLLLLEQERDIANWLREKVRRATLDKRPLTIFGLDF